MSQYLFDHIRNAALMHHERSDGGGYPMRLSGNQIDPYARIVAIADIYDAMTAALAKENYGPWIESLINDPPRDGRYLRIENE